MSDPIRSYCVGAPVVVNIYDDGSVSYAVDLSEVNDAPREEDDQDIPEPTRIADEAVIDVDINRRKGWAEISRGLPAQVQWAIEWRSISGRWHRIGALGPYDTQGKATGVMKRRAKSRYTFGPDQYRVVPTTQPESETTA